LSRRIGALIAALLLASTMARAAAPPPPWARNDLEKLLVAASSDPAQRAAFLHAMLAGPVCALTDQQVPADLTKVDPRKSFKIAGVQAPDGQPATPIFTAPERAPETFPGMFPLCLKGSILFARMRGQRVVLDPGQPYGVLWTADDVDHILGVERTASIANVQFTTPEKPPAALVAALKSKLGGIADIKGAWLALAYWPEQKEWAWFLELHTDAAHKPIEDVLDTITLHVDMEGKPMDTSFLPPDAPPGKGIALFVR
jgi:hypothetical protein